MHKSKIFVVILIVALLVAGTAQVLRTSTWLGPSAALPAAVEQTAQYVQTAALYAFVPLALGAILITKMVSHKDKRETYLSMGASSEM